MVLVKRPDVSRRENKVGAAPPRGKCQFGDLRRTLQGEQAHLDPQRLKPIGKLCEPKRGKKTQDMRENHRGFRLTSSGEG